MAARRWMLGIVALCALTASAQTAAPAAESRAIVGVLQKSAEDWNRGDLDAFAMSYKNSPEILFLGKTTRHGYAEMLATYKSAYGSAAKRGTLTFSELAVQPLDERFATVTGWFHLKRTAEGGGDAQGYFLLVMERTPDGWKIVRDDTTDATPANVK